MKSLECKIGLGLLKNIELYIKRIWGETEDSAGIMSQLDKCLKFRSVGGALTIVHYTK